MLSIRSGTGANVQSDKKDRDAGTALEATRNKCIATRNKCHASSNKCLTSSNKEATRNKCVLGCTRLDWIVFHLPEGVRKAIGEERRGFARSSVGQAATTTSNLGLQGTRASLLGAPGIATRNKNATRGSWPYY